MKRVLIFILILGLSTQTLLAQEDNPINVLFLMDGSSSMLKNWGKEDKWTIAEKSMLQIADSLIQKHPQINFGLRVYGHQSLPIDNDCEDTELKLPIGKHTLETLKNKLISVKPKGITPLAYTLEQTENDFKNFDGQRNILILITDGSESCLGDPCQILEILLKHEVIVKPVIIGLDIDIESLKEYHCIQHVYNPHTPQEFKRNIYKAVENALLYTTLQVHFINQHQEEIEHLPFFMYSENRIEYTFYQKLKRGEPDTLHIYPKQDYRIEIQTVPKITSEQIRLTHNIHNELFFNVHQCQLNIQTTIASEATEVIPTIPYLIKPSGNQDFIAMQHCNESHNYLFGDYDIEVLSLPKVSFKNVQLNEDKKILSIPAPGQLVCKAKFPIHANLFAVINNELINIYAFKANTQQEIIDLQPGNYRLVYRFDHKRQLNETHYIDFEIQSKQVKEIRL